MDTPFTNDSTIETQPDFSDQKDGFQKIMRILRWVGVIGMLIAGYLFLVRDVGEGDVLFGSYAFFGFSVALTLGGWVCAKFLKDSAGGRTLFGLSAILMPVHVAQQAAFIMAATGGDIHPRWDIGIQPLIVLMATTLPIIVASTWIGYTGWLRKQSRVFAPLYILCNLALLLPMRSPESVAIIGTLMALPCFLVGSIFRKQTMLMNTAEGVFARITLFIPFGLIIGRSVYAGHGSALLLAYSLAFIGVALFYPVVRELKLAATRNVIRLLALSIQFAAWLGFCAWAQSFEMILDQWAPLVVYGVPYCLAMIQLSSVKVDESLLPRLICSVCMLFAYAAHIIFESAAELSIVGFILGTAYLFFSTQLREKWMIVVGIMFLVIALIKSIFGVVDHIDSIGWGGVGFIGFFLVIAVSIIEKKRNAIASVLHTRKNALKDWS
jgi:hypothetical protein